MTICPTCGQPAHDAHDRVLHTGEGKVAIGLTPGEIQDLLTGTTGPTLIVRLLRAMRLLDEERAQRLAATYGIALPPPR